MNSEIIFQGPAELITGPATIDRPVLAGRAIDVCVIADVVPMFPASPANTAAVTGASLPANGRIENIRSLTLTSGTMQVTYRY